MEDFDQPSCGGNTYPPLNVLKMICDNVWIVDGPSIEFGPPLARMKFPTRMTIIRINEKDLLIHSPTPIADHLRAQIDTIGVPRWIIGPNKIHYWWIADWKYAFPAADVYLAPGIAQRAGARVQFPHFQLDKRVGYPWDHHVLTMPVSGTFMTEVVFFHRQSRTLVLTDLIENFEPGRLTWWERVLARLGGITHPDGKMPRDMCITFLPQRKKLRQAVIEMISWKPDRIILAHGLWYEADGAGELKRAFRWLLP